MPINERQMKNARQEADALADQMKDLKGARITAVGAKVETDYGWPEVWPWIEVELEGQKFKVEISRDEEGNGGGRLLGVPYRVPAEEAAEQEQTARG